MIISSFVWIRTQSNITRTRKSCCCRVFLSKGTHLYQTTVSEWVGNGHKEGPNVLPFLPMISLMVYPIDSTKWEARVKVALTFEFLTSNEGRKKNRKMSLGIWSKTSTHIFWFILFETEPCISTHTFCQDPWHFWNRSLETEVCQDEKSWRKKNSFREKDIKHLCYSCYLNEIIILTLC